MARTLLEVVLLNGLAACYAGGAVRLALVVMGLVVSVVLLVVMVALVAVVVVSVLA